MTQTLGGGDKCSCKGRKLEEGSSNGTFPGRADTLPPLLHENKSGINKLNRTDTSALIISLILRALHLTLNSNTDHVVLKYFIY